MELETLDFAGITTALMESLQEDGTVEDENDFIFDGENGILVTGYKSPNFIRQYLMIDTNSVVGEYAILAGIKDFQRRRKQPIRAELGLEDFQSEVIVGMISDDFQLVQCDDINQWLFRYHLDVYKDNIDKELWEHEIRNEALKHYMKELILCIQTGISKNKNIPNTQIELKTRGMKRFIESEAREQNDKEDEEEEEEEELDDASTIVRPTTPAPSMKRRKIIAELDDNDIEDDEDEETAGDDVNQDDDEEEEEEDDDAAGSLQDFIENDDDEDDKKKEPSVGQTSSDDEEETTKKPLSLSEIETLVPNIKKVDPVIRPILYAILQTDDFKPRKRGLEIRSSSAVGAHWQWIIRPNFQSALHANELYCLSHFGPIKSLSTKELRWFMDFEDRQKGRLQTRAYAC